MAVFVAIVAVAVSVTANATALVVGHSTRLNICVYVYVCA